MPWLRWVGGFEHAFASVYGGDYLHGGDAAHALASIANRKTVQRCGLTQDEFCEYMVWPLCL